MPTLKNPLSKVCVAEIELNLLEDLGSKGTLDLHFLIRTRENDPTRASGKIHLDSNLDSSGSRLPNLLTTLINH